MASFKGRREFIATIVGLVPVLSACPGLDDLEDDGSSNHQTGTVVIKNNTSQTLVTLTLTYTGGSKDGGNVPAGGTSTWTGVAVGPVSVFASTANLSTFTKSGTVTANQTTNLTIP
jgi:hypothetical protein